MMSSSNATTLDTLTFGDMLHMLVLDINGLIYTDLTNLTPPLKMVKVPICSPSLSVLA